MSRRKVMCKSAEVTQGGSALRPSSGRRLPRRPSLLLVTLLALLVFGGAQAAFAASPVLEKATPNVGCPGTTVTLSGKNFGPAGTINGADFEANVVPFYWPEEMTVTSSTSATTVIPIFLAVTKNDEKGTLDIEVKEKSSNDIAFTLTALTTCFKGAGTGPTGPTGATGPVGKEGKEGAKGATGTTGPT